MTIIIGIKLTNRTETSSDFQNIISKYGCIIKTRIGLHSTCSSVCANYGIILLEIVDDAAIVQLKKDILALKDITLAEMVL